MNPQIARVVVRLRELTAEVNVCGIAEHSKRTRREIRSTFQLFTDEGA